MNLDLIFNCEQEGFSAEDVEYVRAVILEELPDNLKHQAEGTSGLLKILYIRLRVALFF